MNSKSTRLSYGRPASPDRQSTSTTFGGSALRDLLLPATALAAAAFATGCYGSAPPEPPKVAVAVVPGERIAVESKTETKMEEREKKLHTCPAGHSPGSPQCLVTTTTEVVPVTRTWAAARYGGKDLTLAELVALTDSKWDARIAEINEHRAACEGANTPRWVGTALIIGGLAALVIGSTQGGTVGKGLAIGGLVGVGGGIASYITGYVAFGGARCDKANNLYHALPSNTATRTWGPAEAQEMKRIADDFNAHVQGAPAVTDREEARSTSGASRTPAPPPAPTSGALNGRAPRRSRH